MCMCVGGVVPGFLLETLEDWKVVMEYLATPTSSHPPGSVESDPGMDVAPPTCTMDFSSPATQTVEAMQILSSSVETTPPTSSERDGNPTTKENLLSQLLPSLLWTLNSQTITTLLSQHAHFFQRESWGDREKELFSQILRLAAFHTQQR